MESLTEADVARIQAAGATDTQRTVYAIMDVLKVHVHRQHRLWVVFIQMVKVSNLLCFIIVII